MCTCRKNPFLFGYVPTPDYNADRVVERLAYNPNLASFAPTSIYGMNGQKIRRNIRATQSPQVYFVGQVGIVSVSGIQAGYLQTQPLVEGG